MVVRSIRSRSPTACWESRLGEPAVGLGLVPEKRKDAEVLDGEAERLERSVRDLLSVLGGPGQDRAETTV
jgi:hypothetical protein